MPNFSSEYTLAFEKTANGVLESEDLLKELRRLARHMAKAFGSGKSKTQVSHLEVLGFSTRRFHDITAYIQRQTGKEKSKQEGWLTLDDGKKQTLGEATLGFLESLRQKADKAWGEHQKQFSQEIGEAEGEQKNTLRLKIASVALRHLHSAYLYETIDKKGR
ncbi:hypothetical protein L6R29_19345 [Myxococcota bacterium]|nr:hypothetical protein [Myxococcota bacterium]